METSRAAKFVLCQQATISVASANTRYRQSPLLQGGLEVLCVVIVGVLGTVTNNKTLGKYTEFVNILFEDLVESLFRSSFIEVTGVRSTADFSRKRDSKCQSKKKGNQKWYQNRDVCRVFFDINCRRQSERLLTVTLRFVCGWYRKTGCH